jgi:hypothetical protein
MWLTPERGCQVVEAHDRRLAPALLEAAYVLLAEPRKLRQLLLGQTLLLPDPLTFRAGVWSVQFRAIASTGDHL